MGQVRSCAVVGAALTLLVISSSAVEAGCTVLTPCAGIQGVPTDPSVRAFAIGISGDGSAIAGWALPPSTFTRAFIGTASGITDLGTLGGDYARANGISSDGLTVVGWASTTPGMGSPEHAFRWTSGTGMTDLGTLGLDWSMANAVSGDGSVVVGGSLVGSGDQHAFRWTQATGMQDLGTLSGATTSTAWGISADGTVIVGSSGVRAFRWTQATGMIDLGIMTGYDQSSAVAASRDGSVIVGTLTATSPSVIGAFRWTAATGMTDLGHLGSSPGVTTVHAVSGDGRIIVGTSANHAFRWAEGTGMQDLNVLLTGAGLNLGGLVLTAANALSDSGEIIAVVGYNASVPGSYIVRYSDSAGAISSASSVRSSIDQLARERGRVMAQQHGIVAPLLGVDKPIEEGSEAGTYVAFGSATGGGFARLSSSTGLSLLGGVSWAREDYGDAEIENGVTAAGALRFVPPGAGALIPFAEGGGWLTREASFTFTRDYANGAGVATGRGIAPGEVSYLYGRVGLIARASPSDQVAVAGEIGRQRLATGGYVEPTSASNPFEATVGAASDRMVLAKLKLAWTHTLNDRIDATGWVAGVRAFDVSHAVTATVPGFGLVTSTNSDAATWAEYGARVGYRVTDAVTVDAFTVGAHGGGGIGASLHTGVDLRMKF